jgi:hypothetical protein
MSRRNRCPSPSHFPRLGGFLPFPAGILFVGLLLGLAHVARPADQRPRPLLADEIIVRGIDRHPCVTITETDLAATKARLAKYPWAGKARDEILAAAEPWLRGTDAYWLRFLPPAGACFASGFAGCPICGGLTNFSSGVGNTPQCSWDEPRRIRCEHGHLLPDADHPDAGTGYTAPDGKKFYLLGQWNAWVTEKWTGAIQILAQAYLLTGDERYADRGLLLLDALASIYPECSTGNWDYPEKKNFGRLARPQYQVARTLVGYVDALDWMWHSPSAVKPSIRPGGLTRRVNIVQNMMQNGGYFCYTHSWSGALHNGHADYLRGALAVGCLLDIPEYIDAAVRGPYSINAMLVNNLDRDGTYYETSPNYALHSASLYMTYADMLVNLRDPEYPHGLNLYDNLRLQAAITLPELKFNLSGHPANFGDAAPAPGYQRPESGTFSSVDYLFMERLYAMATDPARHAEAGVILNYLAATQGGLEALRARYTQSWIHPVFKLAEPPPPGDKLPLPLARRLNGSWLAGTKGLAVLRQDGQAVLLRFGPALNHADPDDLAMLYSANGYELSYDIGYGLASTHSNAGWASSTVSHALVTVNEKNQSYEEGSGGSLLGFAALPSAQFVDAESARSYGTQGVRTYRRALALVAGGYLVDCFHVEGGTQHDYGFGSIGTSLQPRGVKSIETMPGSLAPGYAWGEKLGPDGDVIGHPNQPYWNAPPGNGYGFFFDVRRATSPARTDWGGIWTISNYRRDSSVAVERSHDDPERHATALRLHLVGDSAEPVYASAPGLYQYFPKSSYVMARRRGPDLRSTFLAVYEPELTGPDGVTWRLTNVERLGEMALAIHRRDGAVDVVIFGPATVPSPYGLIGFDGDFAYLTGDGVKLQLVETQGCDRLVVAGQTLLHGPGNITAKIVQAQESDRSVELDAELPPTKLDGLVAVFSDPRWSRTSAYHISRAQGRRLWLDASTLKLGTVRVRTIKDRVIENEVPQEYTRSVQRTSSTRFYDGKTLFASDGRAARITSTSPGAEHITLEDTGPIRSGDSLAVADLAGGETVRISLPGIWAAPPVQTP